MRVLLTGGTGFIGSHTAVVLLEAGHEVVLYDNLSNSDPTVVDRITEIAGRRPVFIEGDIRDENLLVETLSSRAIEAVIHFAGLKAVGESVEKPLDYYDNNLAGSISLFKAMRSCGVKKLIFSSSSTVYGEPEQLPLTESCPTRKATNPYGRTKLQIEEMLSDLAVADPSLSIVCLRYFNPIGAHPSGLIGEDPNGIPNNLLPYVARVASGRLPELHVYGNDYATPDGTNLGCGRGYSVLEVIRAFEKASGRKIPYRLEPRRNGDIAANWCDPSLAARLLGWKASRNIDDMCRDAWNFECRQSARQSHSETSCCK